MTQKRLVGFLTLLILAFVLAVFTRGRAFSEIRTDQPCVENDVGLVREQKLLNCARRSAVLDRYDEAIRYTKEALAIVENLNVNTVHNVSKDRYIARLLNNLGLIFYAKGDYQEALDYYTRKRALDIKAYSARGLSPIDGNPPIEFADDLFRIALAHEALGNVELAVDYFERANQKEDDTLFDDFFTNLSEQQKLQYIDILSYLTDTTISMQVQSGRTNPRAVQLALRTVFRRKGRVLDLISSDIELMRSRLLAKDRDAFESYVRLRLRRRDMIAALGTSPNPKQQLDSIHALNQEITTHKIKLKEQLPYLYHTWEAETVEAVQSAIPPNSVLVEFKLYRPFNAKATTNTTRWSTPHYVAYVLHTRGDPQFKDLGPAEAIDADVRTLRDELHKDDDALSVTLTKQAARTLYDRLMRPLQDVIGNKNAVVFLSPDGALNLLPFGALVDENGRYLMESYTFSYLTSGRDLMRAAHSAARRSRPLIVADPDFNRPGRIASIMGHGPASEQQFQNSQVSDRCLSPDFDHGGWTRLNGFAREGIAIRQLLSNATLIGSQLASEQTIKKAKGPSILHIVTHGEFLPDYTPNREAPTRSTVWSKLQFPTTGKFDPDAPMPENMLLRSYIALAGANITQARTADCNEGILTALEVARIDLWGTRLVVLSACETGLGDVANGEGVYGLRRSLIVAGSERQMISLWDINDASTLQLMTSYYKFLRSGAGSPKALTQAQLLFLRSKNEKFAHPHYWAAFIPSGSWKKIDFKTI